jgi:hypothetical protein
MADTEQSSADTKNAAPGTEKPEADKTPETGEKPQAQPPAGSFLQHREGVATGESYEPSTDEVKRRNRRNWAIAAAVLGFVIMVYLITLVRLGVNLQAGA